MMRRIHAITCSCEPRSTRARIAGSIGPKRDDRWDRRLVRMLRRVPELGEQIRRQRRPQLLGRVVRLTEDRADQGVVGRGCHDSQSRTAALPVTTMERGISVRSRVRRWPDSPSGTRFDAPKWADAETSDGAVDRDPVVD
jgi:hypothetical protein